MTSVRHISFRRLGTSEVHLRYLEEDRDLGRFLGMRTRSVGELTERVRKYPLVDRITKRHHSSTGECRHSISTQYLPSPGRCHFP